MFQSLRSTASIALTNPWFAYNDDDVAAELACSIHYHYPTTTTAALTTTTNAHVDSINAEDDTARI